MSDNPRVYSQKEEKMVKEIKGAMRSLESAPPPYAWDKISSQLSLSKADNKERKPIPWHRSLAFAAAVLLVVGFSSAFFSQLLGGEDDDSFSFRAIDMLGFDEMSDSDDKWVALDSDLQVLSQPDSGEIGALDIVEEQELPEPIRETLPHIRSNDPRVPDRLGDFLLRKIEESVGLAGADFYLFSKDDQEFWLVISEFNPKTFGDFTGLEESYIPEKYLEDIDENTTRALVRDNQGSHIMVWMYGNEYYLIWSKSDNISRRDILELRLNWPS